MTDYSKITALYSRLSVGDEDRDGGESNSIQNQKIFLEIKLLHTCEINALSRDSCKTDMSFCKINSFPFFVQMIFALSYKEDTNGCKPINLYSGCVSSIRLMLLILLT